MSGAVDLSALKERASAPPPPGAQSADGAAPSGTGLAPVVDATEATFESEILERSQQVVVLVELWAAWSEPCTQLSTVLERLAVADGGTWVLAKVDVDANPRIAQAFGVQSIPTVVAVAAGQPLADFQGVQPEENIREWLGAIHQAVAGKLSGPPSSANGGDTPEDPRFVAAEQALEEGDLGGAEDVFQRILEAEPDNKQALGAVRQVRFLIRVRSLASDAVARADAEPDNVDAQLDAADAELYSQQPEAGFGRLIGVVARSAGDDKTRARTRLLELFELFDPAEPVVMAARRKLASALY